LSEIYSSKGKNSTIFDYYCIDKFTTTVYYKCYVIIHVLCRPHGLLVCVTRRHQSAKQLSVPQAVVLQQHKSAGTDRPAIVIAEVSHHTEEIPNILIMFTYTYIHTHTGDE
jgi:hypothetical protein